MYLGSSYDAGAPSASGMLNGKAVQSDDESRLAATLRRTHGGADASGLPHDRFATDGEPSQKARSKGPAAVAAEIARAIEARLPARVRNLRVHIERDQFILRGVSGSYYVKQLAGHLAMTTLEAHLLGRLVNEIEVRSVR